MAKCIVSSAHSINTNIIQALWPHQVEKRTFFTYSVLSLLTQYLLYLLRHWDECYDNDGYVVVTNLSVIHSGCYAWIYVFKAIQKDVVQKRSLLVRSVPLHPAGCWAKVSPVQFWTPEAWKSLDHLGRKCRWQSCWTLLPRPPGNRS